MPGSEEPAPGVRSTNERLPERYLAAVGTTGTAVASVERLTEATARAEFCFTGLRQTVGIDVASFHRRFGTELAAALHVARTVVRRAERLAVALAEKETVNPEAIKYLNRLSDHLFQLARTANDKGLSDVLWRPGANR